LSRYHTHLDTAKKIIEQYDGTVPLAAWLKDFFRQHKQMGSGDRRIISALVFGYYRLGHSGKDLDPGERILTGLFLSNHSDNELLNHLKPEWESSLRLPLAEKMRHCKLPVGQIFPWQDELSDDVDIDLFNQSFLLQPDLFLRIRPGHQEHVLRKLTVAGITYRVMSESCLAVRNATKLDLILELDREAVIQDYNSQETGRFLGLPVRGNPPQPLPGGDEKRFPNSGLPTPGAELQALLWDCCAASGGKSIMAHDLDPLIRLTVSDIRESILQNLHKRFKRAEIKNYKSFVTDLTTGEATSSGQAIGSQTHIIADLPCSGSGTWARTPEQLFFFNPKKINQYSRLQKSILANIIPALAPGGQLIYITCSVFKKENEHIVEYIKETGSLNLLKMQLLKGYAMKADSMFVAVLTKG